MCVRELVFRLLLRGLRADSLFAYPHGALRFDWVYAKCIAGFREKGWSGVERFATLWGIRGEFRTTYISKSAFLKTLVYFQRAHPPFVFYFTATFISFSCCLIRARSPV